MNMVYPYLVENILDKCRMLIDFDDYDDIDDEFLMDEEDELDSEEQNEEDDSKDDFLLGAIIGWRNIQSRKKK